MTTSSTMSRHLARQLRLAAPRVQVRAVSNAASSAAPGVVSPAPSTPSHAGPSAGSSTDARKTHFGFQEVPETEKESLGEYSAVFIWPLS